MKKIISSLVILLAIFVIPFQASAHISVQPSESNVESWETYTMKVPSEKDAASKKIVLKVPKGVSFESYEPVPGWTTTVDKKNDTVTWQTEGNGIEKGQFQRFSFIAKNPSEEGEVAWNAYQYYEDGSIVEWVGAEDSETPHATTKIVKESSNSTTGSHGEVVAGAENTAEDKSDASDNTILLWTAVAISVIALITGILAILSRKK
ncbi:YcnI [Listeria marthii FSL S4-120]|uniref:YcnI n=1 Tax=Listeria marthii FSL S4-120 TaxID=702457 RepID=A0ABP2JW75_9LIST|nr:YcnI [Listeria marthii FSL S4-120]